jgi:hypothetical protein
MATKSKSKRNAGAASGCKNTASSKTKLGKAGLTLPIGRIDKKLRALRVAPRVGGTASVYLCGVIEKIITDIIVAQLDAAASEGTRVGLRHTIATLAQKDALTKLLGDISIASTENELPSPLEFILSKEAATNRTRMKEETKAANTAKVAKANIEK